MYKNRISRTTPQRHPQFFIRRSDIAFDERVKYVEHVCATLIESRFGPNCVTPVIIDLSDRPEPGATVFYDLFDGGEIVPSYALSYLGRNTQAGRLRSDKFFGTHDLRAKQWGLWMPVQIHSIPRHIWDAALREVWIKHRRCDVIQPAASPQEM